MRQILLSSALVLLIGSLILWGRHYYMTPTYVEGEQAPQFEALQTNGDLFKLSSTKGKYVLVHFWGRWCGPCRVKNPMLQELWLNFKDKTFKNATGFEIVSIAVEVDARAAERAKRQDVLSWSRHITDLSDSLKFFNSPVSNIWGVNQVPSTFLLNPDGGIIGYNLSTYEITKHLNKEVL